MPRFAILQFLDKYKDWATKDMEVIWIDSILFIGEKFVRTFSLATSW